jgi:hypothetical protein
VTGGIELKYPHSEIDDETLYGIINILKERLPPLDIHGNNSIDNNNNDKNNHNASESILDNRTMDNRNMDNRNPDNRITDNQYMNRIILLNLKDNRITDLSCKVPFYLYLHIYINT